MKKKTAAMLSAAAFAAGSALTLKLQQELKRTKTSVCFTTRATKHSTAP